MAVRRLRETLRPWLEAELGTTLDACAGAPVPVIGLDARAASDPPLYAVKCEESAVMTVRPDWVEPLQRVMARLSVEELFSYLGVFELSRAILPDGFTAWGPYWCFAADAGNLRPVDDSRVRELEPEEVRAAADPKIFWHCFLDEPMLRGFGIFEDERLVSLVTVKQVSDQLLELGADTAPGHKGLGLGRAALSAGSRWILDQGKLALATTSPWNVPSARTIKSIGFANLWSGMIGWAQPLQVPPQVLGSPRPGTLMQDYYPDWATNKDIQPKS